MTSPTIAIPVPRTDDALHLEAILVVVRDGREPRTVLDGVTLDVARGHLVAVMGPSGAGKSTLVDVASGLVLPTHGWVSVLGRHPTSARTAWWAARRRDTVGIVHQRLNLLGGLTATDNVALALELLGHRRGRARSEARSCLDRVGAGHVASTEAERLSVGEQQRVAIARAIAGERPVLLADEPAAALDRTAADEVTALLGDLAREGRAVLLVTHDSQQASWADRTILLRDGRITGQVGPT